MKILTLNECGLVAGGLRPRSDTQTQPNLTTTGTASPDLLPPGGGPGGGGYGYGYIPFTGGSYGLADFFSGNAAPFSASASGQTVTFTNEDGSSFTQTGNHPDRDNNPLDVEYGNFAMQHSAIGVDEGGSFKEAIFATAQDGWNAAMDLVGKDGFSYDMTLNQIIATLSPPDQNPTATMQNTIPKDAGLIGSNHWNVLSTASQAAFLTQYAHFEGYPVAERGGYQ